MASIQNYLIISAISLNRPTIITELSKACVQSGCNLLNTQINLLGDHLAFTLFLSGNWGAIAKMETTLPRLEKRLGLSIQTRRTDAPYLTTKVMPYSIQIIALDRPGILNELSAFLNKTGVFIESVNAYDYITHAETKMANIHCKIIVPETVHLAQLRESFMTYCDKKNIDGFIEPIKPQ